LWPASKCKPLETALRYDSLSSSPKDCSEGCAVLGMRVSAFANKRLPGAGAFVLSGPLWTTGPATGPNLVLSPRQQRWFAHGIRLSASAELLDTPLQSLRRSLAVRRRVIPIFLNPEVCFGLRTSWFVHALDVGADRSLLLLRLSSWHEHGHREDLSVTHAGGPVIFVGTDEPITPVPAIPQFPAARHPVLRRPSH
jgi:hypothetical protein